MRAPVPAPLLSSWAQRNLQAGGSEVRRIAEPKKRIEKEENAKHNKHRSCRDFNCILHTNWETTTKSALTKQLIYRLPSIKLLLHGSFRTLTQRLIDKEWRGSSYAVFRLKVLWIPPIVVNASGGSWRRLGRRALACHEMFFHLYRYEMVEYQMQVQSPNSMAQVIFLADACLLPNAVLLCFVMFRSVVWFRSPKATLLQNPGSVSAAAARAGLFSVFWWLRVIGVGWFSDLGAFDESKTARTTWTTLLHNMFSLAFDCFWTDASGCSNKRRALHFESLDAYFVLFCSVLFGHVWALPLCSPMFDLDVLLRSCHKSHQF